MVARGSDVNRKREAEVREHKKIEQATDRGNACKFNEIKAAVTYHRRIQVRSVLI